MSNLLVVRLILQPYVIYFIMWFNVIFELIELENFVYMYEAKIKIFAFNVFIKRRKSN